MKHLLQKHKVTITQHFLSALPDTEVCIYFLYFCLFKHPQITILYPQSPFRYSQKSVSVRFGNPFRYSENPFRYPRESVSVRFGSQKSVSVLRESVSVSTKVRFGSQKSVSVLRESVSVSTKVRFRPFR